MTRTRACVVALVALVVVVGRCLGDGPPGKAGVEDLLRQMSNAAKAGDKEGFLRCVDGTDPVFRKEQENWCIDMEKHPPREVSFSLLEDPPARFGEEEVHATIAVEYTSALGAATGGAKAQWRALFVRREERWVYAGEDWFVMECDGFVIKYFPGSIDVATEVAKAFPAAREHVNEGFGVKPGTQQIKLFNSMDHLKASVYLNMPDPVLGGWNESGEAIKFMTTYTRGVDKWTAAFAHEYGHVATWEYGPGIKTAPWWVSEGVAELAAEDLIPGKRELVDKTIRARAASESLVKWEEIADYDTAAQSVKHMAYLQGQHMVGYISEHWGRSGRTRWLKAMGGGKSLDEATSEALGLSFHALDKRWRASVGGLAKDAGSAGDAALDGIEKTMRGMEAAAVAGDAEGYLRFVDRSDAEFLKEQTYFANDLHKKPAQWITLEVGDLTLKEGAAEGMFTMTWAMPQRKERSVSFNAEFVKGDSGWLFAGETWERHPAPGVLVMCDPGLDELAKQTVQAFSDVREHVETGFMLTDKALPRKVQKIKQYGSMRHLQASICLSYENSLGGWNEPGESIKLLSGPGAKAARLRNVLAHEYGHVATFELGPKSNSMPWWVLEGVADLSAEAYAGKGSARAENAAKNGKLADWAELSDFETCKQEYMGHVYWQGQHMLGYISDRWGREGRVRWLTAMAQGASIDAATREVFSMPFAQLNEEWRTSLPAEEHGEKAAAPTGTAVGAGTR